MLHLENVKTYFWFFFYVIGGIFFWIGVWDGIGNLGYLVNPVISLLVGSGMLVIAKFLFKGTGSFFGIKGEIHPVFYKVHHHEQKHKFHFKYHDKKQDKKILVPAATLKRIEENFLVFVDKTKKEVFVPVHRVKEILYEGKSHWKS